MIELTVIDMSKLDKETKDALAKWEIRRMNQSFVGDRCPLCGKVFDTVDSMQDTVWAPNPQGHIACGSCWDRATSDEKAQLKAYYEQWRLERLAPCLKP